MTKVCGTCKKEKLISEEFYIRDTGQVFKQCRVCEGLSQKNNHLKRKYGISYSTYVQMLVNQGFKCAVCGKDHAEVPGNKWAKARLAVDHDHITGEIRGLLCFECNTGIGHFGDSPERLRSAARYLELERKM